MALGRWTLDAEGPVAELAVNDERIAGLAAGVSAEQARWQPRGSCLVGAGSRQLSFGDFGVILGVLNSVVRGRGAPC